MISYSIILKNNLIPFQFILVIPNHIDFIFIPKVYRSHLKLFKYFINNNLCLLSDALFLHQIIILFNFYFILLFLVFTLLFYVIYMKFYIDTFLNFNPIFQIKK